MKTWIVTCQHAGKEFYLRIKAENILAAVIAIATGDEANVSWVTKIEVAE